MVNCLIFFIGFVIGAARERVLNAKHTYLPPKKNIDFDILSWIDGTDMIKSIKRHSDNKIFSIGDKVKIGDFIWNIENIKYNSQGQLVATVPNSKNSFQAIINNIEQLNEK